MAFYHKDLKYHDDTTEKRELSPGDIEFLLQLQREMNTQDTTGTADPRFWVIKGSERVRDNDDPDGYDLIVNGQQVATGTNEACEYLNKEILPDCDVDKSECRIEATSMIDFYEFALHYKDCGGEDDHDYMDVDDLNEFLKENGYEDTQLVGFSIKPVVYPGTMFITEKAAREHLQSNHYHYSDDAHTYCMCAWRSPDVERLWKILREVKWDELQTGLECRK